MQQTCITRIPVKPNIHSVRIAVNTVGQESVKGFFQVLRQWGSMPPNFRNFPKLTNQQPRPLFSDLPGAHRWEVGRALHLYSFHCPFSLLSHTIWVRATTDGEVLYSQKGVGEEEGSLNRQLNNFPTTLFTQLAFKTNEQTWIPVLPAESFVCEAFFIGTLLPTVSAL